MPELGFSTSGRIENRGFDLQGPEGFSNHRRRISLRGRGFELFFVGRQAILLSRPTPQTLGVNGDGQRVTQGMTGRIRRKDVFAHQSVGFGYTPDRSR